MKRLLLLALLTVVASLGSSSAHAQAEAPAASPSPSPAAKEEHACADCLDCHGDEGTALRQMEQDWADAVTKHDPDTINRIEADEFICTDPTGVVTGKKDDLEVAKSADLKIDQLKLEDIKASIYGDAAVLTGKTTFNGTVHDQTIGGTYRWTDTFVRREGRWQVVASQATNIAASQPDKAE